MRHPDPNVTLLDMMNAAGNIRRFLEGIGREAFLRDEKTQKAVICEFLILGEAAKRLPESFRGENAEIPWAPMSRMRDRLIHGYHDINLGIVWDTARKEVPVLIEQLRDLLPEEGA